MSLAPGTRLGVYEVLAAIGHGGMGDVYRARDTELGRQVAIKVLPDTFAHDPDRLTRFEREARVLASLNHPNIAHVYGFERVAGASALVMELVEGPTLADRIAQGSIPLDETLAIAGQIAEALETAHEQGIIHRDLKPANIKVREDGTVKVLDFGLAKALEPAEADLDVSHSPTITSPAMTRMGVILGTAAYMAPEQAKGRPVDQRGDIWAFGCVLYEMLTGTRAFAGEDVSDTLAFILTREPDWNLLPADTPAAIRRLLRRCLQKNARERLHDISDARLEMHDAQAEAASTGVAHPVPAVTWRRRERLAWAAAAVSAVIAVAALRVAWRPNPRPTPPEMRVEISTPATSSPYHFVLSPDGSRLAFVASGDGLPRLWVRALEAVAAQPLAGTENAEFPFWSPDSRSIGFFADGKLKRVDVAGGPPPQVLAEASGAGGAWNPDGTILFAAAFRGPLWRVSDRGGEPRVVTRIGEGQDGHRSPFFLPDSRRFLFFATGGAEAQGIYLGSLDGGEPRRLMTNESAGAWAPPGWILFVRQGALLAAPFDAEKGELSGEPVTVADAVGRVENRGGFSVSAGGLVAYRAGGSERRQLMWFARDGQRVGTAGGPDGNILRWPELSPDGRRVAVVRTLESYEDVWLLDLVRGGMTRFTFDAARDGGAVWSPDGTRVAFPSNRKSALDLYVKPSSGTGREELLWESPNNPKIPLSWSPDGRFLLFYDVDPKTDFDLWTLPLTGDEKPSPWLDTPFTETLGQFSPDGRWIAYQSNESGQFEIYVQSFPVASGKWQISTQGGTQPRWRADGKELFFIAPDLKLMAAGVIASTATFDATPPVALFQTRIVGGPNQFAKHQYAVSRDGRFLIIEPLEEPTATPITLILNWNPRP